MRRIIAGLVFALVSLSMVAVAEKAQATCSNPTYGNVYCNPGAPAPVPHRR